MREPLPRVEERQRSLVHRRESALDLVAVLLLPLTYGQEPFCRIGKVGDVAV